MSSLDHIFGKPKKINELGNIYPVRVKDWEAFEDVANILLMGHDHITLNDESKDIFLLDKVALAYGYEHPHVIDDLCEIFRIVLRVDKVDFRAIKDEDYYFISDKEHLITRYNYDDVRKVIMTQNLLFEPKVYSDPLLQEWAEMTMKAREKKANPNGKKGTTLEDMISTLAALSDKTFEQIEEYTIYQLRALFSRILLKGNYDTLSHMLANPYASKVDMEHFADNIDMFKSPYEDIFVDSSKKLSKLNDGIK